MCTFQVKTVAVCMCTAVFEVFGQYRLSRQPVIVLFFKMIGLPGSVAQTMAKLFELKGCRTSFGVSAYLYPFCDRSVRAWGQTDRQWWSCRWL